MIENNQHVPLTDDEKDLLNTIFNTRIRLFVIVYMIMIIIGAISAKSGLDYRYNFSNKYHHWEEYPEARTISRSQMYFIGLSFLESIIIGSGIIIFSRRIWCYRRDIESGVKELVPFTIVRKEYFQYTQQYFLGLDNPDYMHHEVDEGTYNNCNEGDIVYLRKAIKSKYIFEENGRFTLM